MTINNVNNDNTLYQVQQKTTMEGTQKEQNLASEEKVMQAKQDKLEISNEAKKLQTSSTQQLQQVKNNILTGYYNRPDVIGKVAGSIEKAYPTDSKMSK